MDMYKKGINDCKRRMRDEYSEALRAGLDADGAWDCAIDGAEALAKSAVQSIVMPDGVSESGQGWRREDLEMVTFWLTNILRYLPNEKVIELHKQIGNRISSPPEV